MQNSLDIHFPTSYIGEAAQNKKNALGLEKAKLSTQDRIIFFSPSMNLHKQMEYTYVSEG